MRNLKHLDLGYTKNIDDKLILGLAENEKITSSLEKLSLRLLKAISPEAIVKLLVRSKRIIALDISGCVRLEGSSIFCVLSNTRI